MTELICGNCTHYLDNMDGWGVCEAPLPMSIRVAYEFDIEIATDASSCECWSDNGN